MKSLFELFKKDTAWSLLLMFVFCSAISMPLARIFILACFVNVLIRCVKQKRYPRIGRPCVGWLIYFALAIVASCVASACLNDPMLDPSRGLGKLDKLMWFIGVPLIAILVDSKERFVQLLKWYVVGSMVAAILVFVLYPLNAWIMCVLPKHSEMAIPAIKENVSLPAQWLYHFTISIGVYDSLWEEIRKYFYNRPESFSMAFVLNGTMQGSQRLMVAIPAAFFLIIASIKQKLSRKQILKWVSFLIVIFLALVLTCKRGPLLAAFVVMLPLVFYYFKRSSVLIVVILVATVFAVPSTRMRIFELPEEFTVEKGGRYAMWTQIVPNVHEEHPYGIGFMALTTEKMRHFAPNMENRPHTHVHSTPLQIFVDFSWLGVFVYVGWLLLAIIPAVAYFRRGAGLYAIIPGAIVLALTLFALVEYNLADGEVVLLYCIGMGLCDCAFLNKTYASKNNELK